MGIRWIFAALFITACSSVELRGSAPKTSGDPLLEPIATDGCATTPTPLCTPQSASAEGCSGTPDEPDAATAAIPTDASFPVGCVVNIPAKGRTPQGECLVEYACRCGTEHKWMCIR